MIQPCRQDCPDRSMECRLTCEKWKAFEAYKKKVYAARAERGRATCDALCVAQRRKDRWRR